MLRSLPLLRHSGRRAARSAISSSSYSGSSSSSSGGGGGNTCSVVNQRSISFTSARIGTRSMTALRLPQPITVTDATAAATLSLSPHIGYSGSASGVLDRSLLLSSHRRHMHVAAAPDLNKPSPNNNTTPITTTNANNAVSAALTPAQKEAKDTRITQLGLYSNIGLTVVKAAAGIAGNSVALIADAVHGLSDMVTDAVTLLTIKHASAPADQDHPYGHGRIEDVGTLAVSGVVLLTGLGIGWHAVERIAELAPSLTVAASAALDAARDSGGAWGRAAEVVQSVLAEEAAHGHSPHSHHGPHSLSMLESNPPSTLITDANTAATAANKTAAAAAAAKEELTPAPIALAVAIASVAVKEALYHMTKKVAAETGSRIVDINAWHHRSDAASSLIAVVGVAGAMVGAPVLDPVAALVVAGMITKQGFSMGLDVFHDITERQIDGEILAAITAELARCAPYGVLGHYGLRGRKLGRDIIVDLTIIVPAHFSVADARVLAEYFRARVLALPDCGITDALVSIDGEGSPSAAAGVAADRDKLPHGHYRKHAHERAHTQGLAHSHSHGGHGHAPGHSHGLPAHSHDAHGHTATDAESAAASVAVAAVDAAEPRRVRSQEALERDIAAVVAADDFAATGLRLGSIVTKFDRGALTASVEVLLTPTASASANALSNSRGGVSAAASAASAASLRAFGAVRGDGMPICVTGAAALAAASPLSASASDATLPTVTTTASASKPAVTGTGTVLQGLCSVHGVAGRLQRRLESDVAGLDKAIVVLRLAG